MRAEPDRQPWLLLAPVLSLLILLLVVPIAIMVVFTFYTFVTAGVEKRPDAGQLARIPERSLLSTVSWKTVRVATITAWSARSWDIRRLFHCHDPLPAQMAAPAPADRAFLDRPAIRTFLDPYSRRAGRHQCRVDRARPRRSVACSTPRAR